MIKARMARRVASSAVLLALAACGGGEEQTGRSDEANDATAAAIADDVADIPGVRTSSATYQDSFDLPGNIQVSVGLMEGQDPEQTRDEIYRIVWQSEIDPLDRIQVVMATSDDRLSYEADLDSSTTELFDEQFGERP